MEQRGFEPPPPACHAVAKKLANTGNYSFYDSILTWLTMTAKFIIKKHQPAVASYLGFYSDYHSRQEEIEIAREEAS